MKSSIIGKLFILLTVFLISLMAVSAADLSVNFVGVKTGNNPESTKIYSNSNPVFCKFQLASTNANVKANLDKLEAQVTWNYNGENQEPINIVLPNGYQLSNYLKTNFNGDLNVADSLTCKVDATWTDPVDSEKQFQASGTSSITVLNTNPTLNFGGNDILTINEDSDTNSWSQAPVNFAGDVDQGIEGLTFTVSSDSNKVSCSVEATGESLTFKPAANYFNTNSNEAFCEVTVKDSNGGSASDKLFFKVNKGNDDSATLNSIASQTAYVGETFTLDMVQYVSNPDGYSVDYVLTPTGTTTALPVGLPTTDTNDKFTFTPTVANKGTYTVKVTGTYNGVGSPIEKTFTLTVKEHSCLVIKDIDAKKGQDGTDSESGVDQNGGTIDEVEPGDKLKIDIELENVCKEETDNDHDINDIELTVTLQEMADEGDRDEDLTYDDLKSDDSDSQTVTFSVPIDADEGSYEMTIEGKGYDDKSNDLYEIDPVKITVKVEKPNDKLKFKTFTLNPSTISCTKKTQLSVKLLNTGSSDEEVQLVLSSSELNIEEIELFTLEEGDADDDDTMYTKTYTFDVPSNAATGSYVITGKAYYNSGDDEETETASAILTVAGCGTTSTSASGSSQQTYDSGSDETSEEVEVVSTPAPVTTTTTTQTVTAEPPATTATTIGGEESFFESSLYIGLLVAGIIVVLLVIVVLIVAVSRR